jgi:MurNAc alpha-1-phosphate uridylyltransferase
MSTERQTTMPRTAMVLAAGLGERMRPLTERLPKPLVAVAGKPLLDHVLDRLSAQGVERVVVNVHYLANLIERHVASRHAPQIVISDERAKLLNTGGGVVKALPKLGAEPFFHINSDTIWIDGVRPNLQRLAEAFDPDSMDALLLLAAANDSIGYSGRGDFLMAADGRLTKRAEPEIAPFVYAGAALLRPELFRDAPDGAFPLTVLFDRAAEAGRLHGLRLEGVWMHVGTPGAIAQAEAAITASAA